MRASSVKTNETLSQAKCLVAAGLSIIPVKGDGSKAPPIRWTRYQSNRANDKQLESWFGDGGNNGIAAVAGKISEHLEVLDFDEADAFGKWLSLLCEQGRGDLFNQLIVVSTPSNGFHIYYRCSDGVEGNQKLARRAGEDGKPDVLVETRGEGGYVVLPGSPDSCHPSNKPYKKIRGDLSKLPTITEAERGILLQSARALNEYVEPSRVITGASIGNGDRPGDDFNHSGRWEEILEPHDWQIVRINGETAHWRRPGKERSVSATTNFAGSNRLYVFSTNADPFESERAYDKFAAYTFLNHSGDFSVAAADLAAQGYGSKQNLSSLTSLISQPSPDGWRAPLGDDALHGLAGDIVRTIEPHTEADPAALLIQFLAAFGNAINRSAYIIADGSAHYMNLYVLLVGETAKSRKGTSWGHIRRVVEGIDSKWVLQRIQDGLSSGEGLIWAVRDSIGKDPGVLDKRLLIVQGEFAGALKVLRREGNTLSAVIRNAWDTGTLNTLVKNSPAKATDAHISIIGHITRQELLRHLDETETANGFGNRFLIACVKRSKVLPHGGKLKIKDLKPLIAKLKAAVKFGRRATQIRWSPKAKALWSRVYSELSEGKPGLLGSMIAIAEAQALRLASIYALLDCKLNISEQHLKAALEVWRYCEDSCRYIFGESLGDPLADKLLLELRQVDAQGLSKTKIHHLFQRHESATQIDRALAHLEQFGFARRESKKTGGRPVENWLAVQSAKEAK